MRCLAYTLELAAHDPLNSTADTGTVQKVRKVVKQIRSQAVLSLLQKIILKKPILDVHRAIARRLLWLREFCDEFIANDNEHGYTQEDWQSINSVVASLTPV